MPCRTPDPLKTEVENNKVAQFLRFLLPLLDKPVPEIVELYASGICAKPDLTPMLCEAIKSIPDNDFIDMMNRSRHPLSKFLIGWWWEHQRHDRINENSRLTEEEKCMAHEAVHVEYLYDLERHLFTYGSYVRITDIANLYRHDEELDLV